MRPDYQLIAELEYALGFTDEPPPPRRAGSPPSASAMLAVLKEVYAPLEAEHRRVTNLI